MYWLERAHSRARGSAFVVQFSAALALFMLMVGLFIVGFIPKLIVDTISLRKHRERVRQYQERERYFRARGWGWSES